MQRLLGQLGRLPRSPVCLGPLHLHRRAFIPVPAAVRASHLACRLRTAERGLPRKQDGENHNPFPLPTLEAWLCSHVNVSHVRIVIAVTRPGCVATFVFLTCEA